MKALLPLLAAVLFSGQRLPANEGSYTLVARSGEQAPGLPPGVNYSLFGVPRISEGGVAFRANLTGAGVTTSNDRALFAGPPGSPVVLIREGDPAPGVTDATILVLFDNINVTPDGFVIFQASLTGTGVNSSNNDVLCFARPGTPAALLAREGGPAADSGFFFAQNTFSSSGVTVAVGDLNGDGAPDLVVPQPNTKLNTGGTGVGEAALVTFIDGVPEVLASTGDEAPGTGDVFAGGFDCFNVGGLRSGDPYCVFSGDISASENATHGFFSAGGSGIQPVLLLGDRAPGAGAGAHFAGFGEFGMNSSEGLLFIANAARPPKKDHPPLQRSMVLFRSGGKLRPLARADGPVPGVVDRVYFQFFQQPLIDESNGWIFSGFIKGNRVTVENNRTIHFGQGLRRPKLLARTGQQAPALPRGVTLQSLSDAPLALNRRSELLWMPRLAGPDVTVVNDTVLLQTELRLKKPQTHVVVRRGEPLTFSGGPQEEIVSFSAVSSVVGGAGGATAMNSLGQVVFAANFTAGAGIIFASPPSRQSYFQPDLILVPAGADARPIGDNQYQAVDGQDIVFLVQDQPPSVYKFRIQNDGDTDNFLLRMKLPKRGGGGFVKVFDISDPLNKVDITDQVVEGLRFENMAPGEVRDFELQVDVNQPDAPRGDSTVKVSLRSDRGPKDELKLTLQNN